MTKTLPHLKPKDTFEVHCYSLLNGEDTRVLNLLYQPIIGGNAVMLYQNLMNNVAYFKEPTPHFILQDMMDNGLQELSQSRVKLEAIGLLKTYVRAKDEGYHYIYTLENIMPPHVFLADDVLSLLLLDRVGEQRFVSLVSLFKPASLDLDGYSDVTSSYTDVFHLTSERIIQSNDLVQQTNQTMKEIPTPKTPQPESSTFDWRFFVDSLSGLNIDSTFLNNELKPIVYTVHGLYGINELEMIDHVKYCLDYVTNQVNVKEFKHRIYKNYHHTTNRRQVVTATPVLPGEKEDTQSLERHKNDLKHQGFTPEEISVILSCEKIAPLVFLKAIKEQKNGFVAQNERWTIENLKAQSKLPDEVINMLIHYSLVVLNNASLNQNMVNTIANNWAQNKVYKASDALNQVKSFKQESTKKATTNNYNRNYSKKPTRKETLPDWASDTTVRKETPLSGEELTLLEQQLKKFNQGGESS